mgnify:CR=1 FL=1
MSTPYPPDHHTPHPVVARLQEYGRLIRLDRPIGILLLLWPTLWALWLAADGFPNPLVLVVFVAGVALMRSAGCAINDYADRDIDPFVERTRNRPLAAGRIHPAEALGVFAALSLAAFALVLLLDWMTVALSLVAIVLAASYPFMKRLHHLPQAHLGAAFGWAVPMAYTAQIGQIPLEAWALFGATLIWALVYDTMYAMADREDDLKIGVKSSAILFGHADRAVVLGLHLLFFALVITAAWLNDLRVVFYAGLSIAVGLSAYQHWLIRNRDPKSCFRAFLNNHWVGFWIFAGIAADLAVTTYLG